MEAFFLLIKIVFMQSMLRRFKFFGIGFVIGMIFVFFFFGNRGCSWLPGGRVKTTIAGKVIVVEENTLNKLAKKGVSKKDILTVLNKGDVDFGSSKKQGNPQVYLIDGEVDGKKTSLWFTIPRDGFVSEVRIPEGNIQSAKNSTTGFAEMIHFPNVKAWVFVDPKPELNDGLTALDYGNEKEVQKALMKTGRIDFSKSNLLAEPNPEHYIVFKSKSNKILGTRCFWYQDHVKISNFFDETQSSK